MTNSSNLQVVTFQTSDGVIISADLYKGSNGSAVVLGHMLSRDRKVWGNFPLKLLQKGYTILNIDLRGHGQSTIQNGHPINYQDFTEEQYAKMPLDFTAAKKYLLNSGLGINKVYFVGASIGANSALVAASQDQEISAIVLLSPGEDYHGVKTFNAAHKYSGRRAFIASSDQDIQSYQPSQKLSQFIEPSAKLVELQGFAHGTDIFNDNSVIQDQIISFIKSH